MSTQSNVMSGPPMGSRQTPPATMSLTRPLSWAVQRELWEHRSLYVAPMAVATLILFGFLISATAGIWEKTLRLDPAQRDKLVEPYTFAALLLMATTFVVAVFYCLDALYGERRDRSILFWKSLPVSDLTTVLAKFSIPVIVIPLVTFSITVTTQLIMLIVSSAALLARGESVTTLWSQLGLFHSWRVLLYHLLALHGLWYAPIYGWLLVVSAWARRMPILWAALPLVAIGIVEKHAFNTSYFRALLEYRMMGPEPDTGASAVTLEALTHPSPSELLVSPGLWIGLAIAAAFLALAVRLRRDREPI
jgi:ABC-2 type transport system permease protein